MAFVTMLFIDIIIIIIKYDFYNLTSKAEKNMIAVFHNYEDRRKERSLIALAFRYM